MPVSKSILRRLDAQVQKKASEESFTLSKPKFIGKFPTRTDLPVLPKKAQTYLHIRFPSLYLGREERKLIRALEKSVTRLGKTLGFTPIVQQPFPDPTSIEGHILPVSNGTGGQYIWLSNPKEHPPRILMVVHLPPWTPKSKLVMLYEMARWSAGKEALIHGAKVIVVPHGTAVWGMRVP